MEDDEEQEPFTAYDYWDEDASIDFKEKLAEITEFKKEDPKFHRFFYNSGRSLDELAYLMMNPSDREELYH